MHNPTIFLHEHLQSRFFDISRYNGVYISIDDYVICFTLWNLSGQMCGYQQYKPLENKDKRNNPKEGRYYTSIHGNKHEKPIALWGIESLQYNEDVLVLCEGIFDACRFHNHDIPAVAVLGSSWKHYKNWILSLNRYIYKAEDQEGSSLGPFKSITLPSVREDFGSCSEIEQKNIASQLILEIQKITNKVVK